MVDVGQTAPDFTLESHTQEGVTLSLYKGEKNVILSFHIFSFTGG
jgi:peroxiredoxin